MDDRKLGQDKSLMISSLSCKIRLGSKAVGDSQAGKEDGFL
jgi:hypothetical protein